VLGPFVCPARVFLRECSVTTSLTELPAPRGALVAALRSAVARDEFFAGLYILGCANGFGVSIIRALQAGDWTGGTQHISVIALFACLAGISLFLRDNKDDEITTADFVVAGAFLIGIAVPVAEMNWAAVTALSFYILLFANDGGSRRRGALIMLALTVPMLWSRLLFAFFAKIFLVIDATFVSWLLGTARTGNIIAFADGSGNMVILPACSSLANMSLAFLCWVAVSQWVDHRSSRQDFLWCTLACASVVAVNVARIAIMGLSHWHYVTFHYGWGATTANAIILFFTIGFTALGCRREIFSRS
jgi:exosortase/archaeosortase family protein